jgi:alpha-tubulin suppressor-like RCC1 family protein
MALIKRKKKEALLTIKTLEDEQKEIRLAKEEKELALERKESEIEKIKHEKIKQATRDLGTLDLENLKLLFNRVDYNTFCMIVTIGNIRGKHLMALYSGSKKLREYCNRSFQAVDKQGQGIGLPEEQYLFYLLLNKMGIRIPVEKTPRRLYIEKAVGGQVWCFGSNCPTLMGLKGKKDKTIPVLNPDLQDIIQIDASYFQVLCLDSFGRVWAFGGNDCGQLGLGHNFPKQLPKMIPSLINIVQVATECKHSLCLDNQGHVWSFGLNRWGQLGLGDSLNRNTPEIIPTLNNIIQVSIGSAYSTCLDLEGHVWTFGCNSNGRLGHKKSNEISHFIPKMIDDFDNIVQISCGQHHTLCLNKEGEVYGFGLNINGELGYSISILTIDFPCIIPYIPKIIKVSAGYDSSLILDYLGNVWVFGKNNIGQLGLENSERRTLKPEEFFSKKGLESIKNSLQQEIEFNLIIPEPDLIMLPTIIPELVQAGIVDIKAGQYYSLCLDNRGQVWTFGYNNYKRSDSKESQINIKPIIIPTLNNVIQISTKSLSSFFIVNK